jgi:hypothetical protein
MLLASLWGSSPAPAADIQFVPTLSVRALRDGNPSIVDEGQGSDDVLQVGLDLAAVASGPKTQIRFGYRPFRETHRRFERFDSTSHAAALELKRAASPRFSFTIGVRGATTERQGIDAERPEEPTAFVPRTRIRTAGWTTESRLRRTGGSFWTWRFGGGVVRRRDLSSVSFEDSEFVEAGVGWSREKAAGRSFELGYRYQHIWFETLEPASVHSLSVSGSRRLAARTRGSLGAGIEFARTGDRRLAEPLLEARLSRSVGQLSTLDVGARQFASSGAGIRGPTRDRGAYLSWRRRGRRGMGSTVVGGYWRREDLGLGRSGPGTAALQTSEALDWTVGRRFLVGLFHSYTDQKALGQADSRLDASYHSGGISVTWNFLAR